MNLQDRMLEMLGRVYNVPNDCLVDKARQRRAEQIKELIAEGQKDCRRRARGEVPRKTYGKQAFTPEVPPIVLADDDPLMLTPEGEAVVDGHNLGDAETAR